MGWTKVFSTRSKLDAARAKSLGPRPSDERAELHPLHRPLTEHTGIALFMVISAMSVLAIIVTEFTYIAQVNQRMAYDGLDQIRAHYLAKTGLKLSLLRLKAYQTVKNFAGGGGSGGLSVPGTLMDKIWSFPFLFPIPKEAPGLTIGAKDALEKFDKETSLVGNFSAVITSESSKINLNQIIPGFAPIAQPAPSPSASAAGNPGGTSAPSDPGGSAGPSATPSFSADKARDSINSMIEGILAQKNEEDPDFAQEYRDIRAQDLSDAIFGWADHSYERKVPSRNDAIPEKKAPFYSITELHMISPMEDAIYDLLAPNFTARMTQGININTVTATTLRALVDGMTKIESDAFFKFRDSTEDDNRFKAPEDFFKWAKDNIASLKSDEALKKFQENLASRHLRILTDESSFKITVQSQVNQAVRLIEAWVDLDSASGGKKSADPQTPVASAPVPEGAPSPKPSTGLHLTFMRIL